MSSNPKKKTVVHGFGKKKQRGVAASGISRHPAMDSGDPLLAYRLGSEEPLRIPDVENTPSAATVLHSDYTISSDAAGIAAWAVHPSLTWSKIVYNVTAGAVDTGTKTTHPQITAFNAEATLARLVGVKVQVTYIGAEQTSAGYLSFQEKAHTSDISARLVDDLHTGAHYQCKAADGMLAFLDFWMSPRYITSVGSAFMTDCFPVGLFVASGLPASTSVYRVRTWYFMEYLPTEGTLSEGDVGHEPANPSSLLMHGELSGISTSLTPLNALESFYARVKAAANAAYHIAQPYGKYAAPAARKVLQELYKAGAGTGYQLEL